MDLEGAVVGVYRKPEPDGHSTVQRVRPSGQVSPAAFPDIVLPVYDLV